MDAYRSSTDALRSKVESLKVQVSLARQAERDARLAKAMAEPFKAELPGG